MNIDISEPRHMYWKIELKDSDKCPKCNALLKREMHSFFVIMDNGKEKMPFIIGCYGNFCQSCPIVVLEKGEFDGLEYYAKNNFRIHVAGIVDLDKIPENQRNIPLGDINPLPIVQFKNYSDRDEHENLIEDKSVFKEDNYMDEQDKPIQVHRKLGRNELCHCGSGKKYKKCCLERDTEKYGSRIRTSA